MQQKHTNTKLEISNFVKRVKSQALKSTDIKNKHSHAKLQISIHKLKKKEKDIDFKANYCQCKSTLTVMQTIGLLHFTSCKHTQA